MNSRALARRIERALTDPSRPSPRVPRLPTPVARAIADLVQTELEAVARATPSPAIVGGVVRFGDPHTWRDELIRDADLVERGIVRVSFRARPILRDVPTPAVLILEGGAIVAGRIVRLEHPLGELWGRGPDADVQQRGRDLADALTTDLAKHDLELREGKLEERDR